MIGNLFPLDYFLYMSEAEGYDNIVTTDTAKINACIKDFVKSFYLDADINDDEVQDQIFENHGLSRDSLTDREINYIIQEVKRKLG